MPEDGLDLVGKLQQYREIDGYRNILQEQINELRDKVNLLSTQLSDLESEIFEECCAKGIADRCILLEGRTVAIVSGVSEIAPCVQITELVTLEDGEVV